MTIDESQLRDFGCRYAEAWCSGDPSRVAAHFAPGGTIAVNGGEPTGAAETARGFMEAFPDIQVFLDDIVVKGDGAEFHWTFTGTNTGPGGTGRWVRISGFEEWTFAEDGLVASSLGHYDQDEYDRQIQEGAPAT
jgi:nuclear transport factor 2 (NTF2) superfamily protein